MARFQSLVPNIPKQKQGYGYLYAPLGDIDRAIKGALRECGLAKTWRQIEEVDQVTVICVVTHEGGHSKEYPIGPVPWALLEKPTSNEGKSKMNGLQHRGAVLTYLQRYSLIGALGLATADADTDGRGKGKKPEPQHQQQEPIRKINREEADQLIAAAAASGIPGELATAIIRKAGFESTPKITTDKFPAILKQIETWTPPPTGPKRKSEAVLSIEEFAVRVNDELAPALIQLGFKGNAYVLVAEVAGTKKLADVAPEKRAAVIKRLEAELKTLREG
jgi:hypothetical protein